MLVDSKSRYVINYDWSSPIANILVVYMYFIDCLVASLYDIHINECMLVQVHHKNWVNIDYQCFPS